MKSKIYTKKALVFFFVCLIAIIASGVLLNIFAVKPYINANQQKNNISSFETDEPTKNITNDGFVYYVLNTDSDGAFVTITKYNGNDMHVKVPNTIEGFDVKLIGNSCFSYCEKIITVEIPKEVIKIEDFAFAGCKSLEKVIINSESTQIGYYVNVDCFFSITAPKDSNAEEYAIQNHIDFFPLAN